jgi:hypothetical protein
MEEAWHGQSEPKKRTTIHAYSDWGDLMSLGSRCPENHPVTTWPNVGSSPVMVVKSIEIERGGIGPCDGMKVSETKR